MFQSKRLALAIAALFVAGAAQAAAPTSGQIVIRGTVGSICEIGVVDYGTNLDLVTGETARAVGAVTETCNDPDGYSVSFTSDQGGKMIGPRDATSAYRINYDSIADYSLASDAAVERPDPQWGLRNELTVNVDGQDQLPAGSYKDVVTVTIAAN